MKICPYCESELSDTARKCKFCGEWVLEKMEGYISDEELNNCIKKGRDGLKGVEYITDEQAEILSSINEYYLYVDGLKSISDKQAKILSKFNGGEISLNGLIGLTDIQAEEFSKFKGYKISLNGLIGITDTQAEKLSNFTGDRICLNGLTSITDTQANYFDIYLEKNRYNHGVELGGIEKITNMQAEIFSKMKQVVELNGIKKLSDKQAEILSESDSVMLTLEGLEEITEKQIELFSKNYSGEVLHYKMDGGIVEIVQHFDGYEDSRTTTVEGIKKFNINHIRALIGSNDNIIFILESMTDDQAEIFKNFSGDYFCIDGLETITDKQTEILSHFKGRRLRLMMKKISNKQKNKLERFLKERITIEGRVYVDNDADNNQQYTDDTIKVFFFDTETTGKDPHVEQIIQFGGIYGIYDRNTGRFEEKNRINQLVKPSKRIPEEASRVHGLYNKDLEEYGFIDEYIYDFLAFIKKADFVVGHNVEYDKTILITEAERLNIPFDFSIVKWVDTMKPCASLVQIPAPEWSNDKYKWPKLIELYKFLFGKEFDNAHDAMADITATKDCFVELCNKYHFYENGKFKERLENNKIEDTKYIEDKKPSKIEKVYNEFKELQHITNVLGEAQSKVKNVECVYNNETGDVRYKINDDVYSEDDIVNIDGYVFLKNIVTKFGGKNLVKSGRYLYNPEDIESTDKYRGIPKDSAKPIACAVYTKYSKELMGYYKPEDVVWVHQGEYFPKKDAIIINFNGKDYYFRNDDDYVFKEYLKKSWSGEWRLKSDCTIVEEKDKNYFWVKKSGIPWEDVLPKIIIIGLIIMVIIYIQKH